MPPSALAEQIERLHPKRSAADILGVSVKTINRMIRRGDLRTVPISPRCNPIPESSLAALIERAKQSAL